MPSWRAHRSITAAATAKLGAALPKEVLEGLLEGVVDPDRAPDKEVRVRVTRRGRTRVAERYVAHHGLSKRLVDYYLNLSLYYLRRGDGARAGFMLGRALHYVQDGALSRRRYLVLDVHDAEEERMNELASTPQRVEEACKGAAMGEGRRSSRAEEALCIALRESVRALGYFVEESGRPVDAAGLRRRVRRTRLAKALAVALSAMLAIAWPPLVVAALLSAGAALLLRPRAYYEAMRAGLMLLRPIGVRTAY